MNIIDIKKEEKEVILLIHPMLSSAKGMKEEIVDRVGGDYRYILPDLSAHGGTRGEYNSVDIEAKNIEKYLLENGINKVLLGYGASLGGVILLKMVEIRKYILKNVFLRGVVYGKMYLCLNLC